MVEGRLLRDVYGVLVVYIHDLWLMRGAAMGCVARLRRDTQKLRICSAGFDDGGMSARYINGTWIIMGDVYHIHTFNTLASIKV